MFDGSAEIANVARPIVSQQCSRREIKQRLIVLLADLTGKLWKRRRGAASAAVVLLYP